MKVGIVTILKVNNYGAELQAYATQAVLRDMGLDAEIIDYLFYKHPDHKRTRRSAPLFAATWRQRLAEWLYPRLQRLRGMRYAEAARQRRERFAAFHWAHTHVSRTYRTIDELYAGATGYDIYLTGSDQVWNPGIYSSLEPYLLDFAPEGRRRVAYAASFGVDHIPDEARDYYSRRLKAYSAIGVREGNAVDLVHRLSGREAVHVLDPTLLLTPEAWMQVAAAVNVPRPYLLIYELTPCPYMLELSLHIARSQGLHTVRLCREAHAQERRPDVTEVTDAGPAEFIGLWAGAGFVVTNSFHGTAFAVNFSRPFYTVLPRRKANNSRQRSLLEQLMLTDRLLVEGDPLPSANSVDAMDYTTAQDRLRQERAKSLEFLEEALR